MSKNSNELDIRVLKSLLSDNVRGLDFANTYTPELFNGNSRLFAKLALRYMRAYQAVPTRRTLKEYAGDSYAFQIEDVWDNIDRYSYNTQEYPFDLDLLKKRYSSQAIEEIKKIAEETNEANPENSIKDIALRLQTIRNIRTGRTFIQKTVKEHMPDWHEQYNAQEVNPFQFERVKTGYSAIDFANGGFAPAELFLIGGESGAGKSMFLMNIGINMWMGSNYIDTPCDEFKKGANILYFSLEMPYNDMFARFLARMASVPERHILDGELTEDEKNRISAVEQFIKDYPYEFDIVDIPRGVTIQEIELRYNDALLKYKPDCVIVDYLGLMQSPDFNNQPDWLKMGALAGELHEFGRANEVIMGSALQLTDINRNSQQDPKKKSKEMRVGGHRIGRSSMILHHANFYIQIESRNNEENHPFMTCHVLKNRRGPKIKDIELRKNFSCATLFDVQYLLPEEKYQEEPNDEVSDPEKMSGLKSDISTELNKALEEKRNKIKNIEKEVMGRRSYEV